MLRKIEGRLVRRFRRETGGYDVRRPPLSRRERWVLILLSLQVVVISWAVGGMLPWAQGLAALLATAAFLGLFVPVEAAGSRSTPSPTARENWRRLRRFPIFWLGLLFLGYIAVQVLNPAWAYTMDERHWWVRALDPVPWLPSGVQGRWDWMTGSRALLVTLAVWLAVCVVWVGVRRRSGLRVLAWVLALNFFFWAVMAVAQDLLEAPNLLWVYESKVPLRTVQMPNGRWVRFTQYYGAMVNPNHAAAFLNLGVVACAALFLQYFERSVKQFARSGPHLLLFFMAAMCGMASFLALSRAGIVLCVAVSALFVAIFAFTLIRLQRQVENPLPGLLLLGLFLFLGAGLFMTFNPRALQHEWEKTRQELAHPRTEVRYHLNRATWDMISERPWFGWGAGGFRYVFPYFKNQYPELRQSGYIGAFKPDNTGVEYRPAPFFHAYAHNDFLQYPAELGLLGCLPLLASLALAAGVVLRYVRYLNAGAVLLFTGCLVCLSHALVDFILYVPAIVTNLVLLWTIGARQLALEADRESQTREVLDEAAQAAGRRPRPAATRG